MWNHFNTLWSSRTFQYSFFEYVLQHYSRPGQQGRLKGNRNIKYRWLLLTAEWKRNKLSNHGTLRRQYMPPSLLSRGPMSALSECLKCLAIWKCVKYMLIRCSPFTALHSFRTFWRGNLISQFHHIKQVSTNTLWKNSQNSMYDIILIYNWAWSLSGHKITVFTMLCNFGCGVWLRLSHFYPGRWQDYF